MKFRGISAVLCLVLSLGCSTTRTTSRPPILPTSQNEYLIQLCQQEYQAEAVHCDAHLVFGWGNADDTNAVKTAAKEALTKLEGIKAETTKIVVPASLAPLKTQLIQTVDGLDGFYQGLANEERNDARDAVLSERWKVCDQALLAFHQSLSKLVVHSENINSHDGISKVGADSGASGRQFLKALRLYHDGQLTNAYAVCEHLASTVNSNPLEHHCLVLMADMLLGMKSDYPAQVKLDADEAAKQGCQYLSRILDSKVYSSVLAMSYRKWRAGVQFSGGYGMSNFSVIPNRMYDAKRVQVLRRIQAHLEAHPDDSWAQDQFYDLLTLDCLQRGMEMGNTNIKEWAEAFPQDRF